MRLPEAILASTLAIIPATGTGQDANAQQTRFPADNPSRAFCERVESHAHGDPEIFEAEFGIQTQGHPTNLALTIGRRVQVILDDGVTVNAECARQFDLEVDTITNNNREFLELLRMEFRGILPRIPENLACVRVQEKLPEYPDRPIIYSDCQAGALEEDDGEGEDADSITDESRAESEEAYIDPAETVDGIVDNVMEMVVGKKGRIALTSSWEVTPPNQQQFEASQRRFETLLKQASDKLK